MDLVSMNLPTDNTWTWTQPSSTVDNNSLSVGNNRQGVTITSLNIPNNTAWTWALPSANEENSSKDRNNKSRTHKKQPKRRSNRHHAGGKNGGRGGVNTSDIRKNQALVWVANSKSNVTKDMRTKNIRHRERGEQHSSAEKNDIYQKKYAPVTRKAPSNRKPAKISAANNNNHRNYNGTTAPTETNNRRNKKKRKVRSENDPMDIDEEQGSSQSVSLTTTHASHAKQQKQQHHHIASKQRRKMSKNNAKDSLSLEEKEYRKQMSHA
mmetsp:Transcript_11159/g.13463  ORF Transcript_11159/g.13463 Transcript_11159/m.13463 type:complete len:266 (-) Transcript_11159:155-952(-)